MDAKIIQVADIAEYAVMHGISYDAAVGVFVLVGAVGLRRILLRK
jgi:hypothetical protein